MREGVWDKYKDEPYFIMLEIYCREECADGEINPFAVNNPDLDNQPSSMKQRKLMYTYYRDSLRITCPSLIDSMDNYFLSRPYESGPDAAYLIGVDSTFRYLDPYIHTYTYQYVYPEIDDAIAVALEEVIEDVEEPVVEVISPKEGDELTPGETYNIEWTAKDNFSVTSRAIYLSKDNESTWELIDSSLENTGTYSWEVPTDTYEKCNIKVYAYDKAKNVGSNKSGFFAIGQTKIIYNSGKSSILIRFKRTQESFMIFLPFSGSNTVTISDVQGKQITSFTTSKDKIWYTIPSSLSSGMHIVSIRTQGKTIVRKFWFIR